MHAEMVGLHRGLEVQGAEVDRLRALLGHLEWEGTDYESGAMACPACAWHKKDGHAPDCWLAAELRPTARK